MSEIFSFRLSENNPREEQAKKVIDIWSKKGYSIRYIITEALIVLDKNQNTKNGVSDTAENLTKLIKMMEGIFENKLQTKTPSFDLNPNFMTSIKSGCKPGLQILDDS